MGYSEAREPSLKSRLAGVLGRAYRDAPGTRYPDQAAGSRGVCHQHDVGLQTCTYECICMGRGKTLGAKLRGLWRLVPESTPYTTE